MAYRISGDISLRVETIYNNYRISGDITLFRAVVIPNWIMARNFNLV